MTTRKTVICPREGSLFDCKAQVLVNPVNCVGVAGAGLAKVFKEKFPENFKLYRHACKSATLDLGQLNISRLSKRQPGYIVNFPTKKHWKEKSELKNIELGLESLVVWANLTGIKSIAIPALGCGLGGLDWNEVRVLIMGAAIKMKRVKVYLFAPQ